VKRFVLASARALETILENAHSFVGPLLKPPTEADRMSDHNIAFHQPADTGTSYWGPGDRYTFLVTGSQNNGAYFIMEGIVPPGGGPPLHIHHREEESLYLLDGVLEITLGEKTMHATTGDFVQIPRGLVHRFHNTGTTTARLLLFFSPAGMEKYFEEVLERVQDRSAAVPQVTEALITRMLGAGPKHGLEFA
jgi:quercetin dioxygenase-like cupin family protein